MMFEKQSAGTWFHHRITEANRHIRWELGIGLQENETGQWIWQWGDNGDFKGFCIANPKKKEAIAIFKFNLAANPASSNAYESPAEGYENIGEKELALQNFKKTVELDPANHYAADRIKELEGETNR